MPTDPLPPAFYFTVQVDGAPDPGDSFAEVSGLDNGLVTAPLAEVGMVQRLPRAPRVSNLVIKRGMLLANSTLLRWCRDTLGGGFNTPIKTATVTVSLLDEAGTLVASWDAQKAFPVKWQVAGFGNDGSSVLVDTVEFTVGSVARRV